MTGESNLEQILAMADQHFPYIDERMERITLQVAKDNSGSIKHIVFAGDGCDNPGMSKFPERPDHDTVLQEEIDMFTRHVGKYATACPDATIYILSGNHDKGRVDMTTNLNKNLASLRAVHFENLLKESVREQGLDYSFVFGDQVRIWDNYFTHGDPRIDPFLKGGMTGDRRTAETHPEQGNIYYGHKHRRITYPRTRGDASVYSIGGMLDIDKISEQYKPWHGYQNGFAIVTKHGKYQQVDNVLVTKGPLWLDGECYD